MPLQTKYDGVSIRMNGEDWVVPALSVRQFRAHQEILTASVDAQQPFTDWQDARLPAILDAMRRNYPDLTEEALRDMLDLRTIVPVWRAVQGLSGVHEGSSGEAPAPAVL